VKGEGREAACRSILIGPGENGEAEVLVGNCAGAGQDRAVDVAGCPPSPTAIYEHIVNSR